MPPLGRSRGAVAQWRGPLPWPNGPQPMGRSVVVCLTSRGRSAAARRMGGQGLDVVGPLEGGRVRDRALAGPAAELVEGLVAVAVHPVADLDLQPAQVVGTIAE